MMQHQRPISLGTQLIRGMQMPRPLRTLFGWRVWDTIDGPRYEVRGEQCSCPEFALTGVCHHLYGVRVWNTAPRFTCWEEYPV